MAGIERAHDEGGADALATVAKRATDAVGRRALAHEATVLGRLAHPGVIRLVAHTETDRHAQMTTERVPGPTLSELGIESPTALAAVGAAGAAVVADLHALGIAHGSLTPDHLIVSGGRVVLCSFGRAAEATAPAMDRDVADLVVAITDAFRRLSEPATRSERRHLRRLDDLLVGAASRSLSAADLGLALAALAGGTADGGLRSPIASLPETASTSGVHPPVAEVPTADDALAAASASVPARPAPDRPARPWRDRVPPTDRVRPSAAGPPPWHRRRNIFIGAVAGLVVVALWAALAPDSRTPGAAPPPTPAAAPPATPTPSPASTPTPPRPLPPSEEAPRVVVVGNLVAVDETWFEVGRSGDIVRIGDWDCDGSLSPAVLRPSTGEVFVFDGWVEGDETSRVEALTAVPDAADMALAPSASCDSLVVVDAAGRESVIEVAP